MKSFISRLIDVALRMKFITVAITAGICMTAGVIGYYGALPWVVVVPLLFGTTTVILTTLAACYCIGVALRRKREHHKVLSKEAQLLEAAAVEIRDCHEWAIRNGKIEDISPTSIKKANLDNIMLLVYKNFPFARIEISEGSLMIHTGLKTATSKTGAIPQLTAPDWWWPAEEIIAQFLQTQTQWEENLKDGTWEDWEDCGGVVWRT